MSIISIMLEKLQVSNDCQLRNHGIISDRLGEGTSSDGGDSAVFSVSGATT